LKSCAQDAQGGIYGFDHSGIDGIGFISAVIFSTVLFDKSLARLQRYVNRILRHVEKERSIFRCPRNDLLKFRCQDFCEVIVLGITREIVVLKRTEIVVGRARIAMKITGDIGFKAKVLRQITVAAQMPFPNRCCPVSGLLQTLPDCRNAQIQVLRCGRLNQLLVRIAPTRNPLRQMQAGGRLAGENRSSAWRTNRSGGISIGKFQALRTEAIDVRRFMKRVPVTA